MVRIAIVEDDPAYTLQLQQYLAQYEQTSGERFAITCFRDGDEIALSYEAKYDIILMDIEMRYMNGMTAAEEIRTHDREVVIIFITNTPQYALKGYAVDALDYVLKPISYYAFSQRIERALARMQRRTRKYVHIIGRESTSKVEMSRIYYVEVQGHDLVYHTADGIIESRGTMKDTEDVLDGSMFFRCNKGFLVNLEQVQGIRDDNAIVGGEEVQISRAKKKAFLDALNNYIHEVSK